MHDVIVWLRSVWEDPWIGLGLKAGGPFLAGLAAAWLAQWVAWWRFTSRDFLHRVNFSLNYVEDNRLQLRTLKESDIDQIILDNKHGRNMLLAAARGAKTSAKAPFLDLRPEESFVVLNAILNELSESFAARSLARSMGLPVKSKWYVFGVTCEWDDEVRNRKIRVMIIAEDLLAKFDQLPPLRYQHPWHHVRHETLLKMQKLYQDDCRAEEADEKRRWQREAELAAMAEDRRRQEKAQDHMRQDRSPPVRHLMRIELGLV